MSALPEPSAPAPPATQPPSLRVIHIRADSHTELTDLSQPAPAEGFLWIGCTRREFEADPGVVQGLLERWAGGQLVDLHVNDLINRQLPSHFDYTSWYDLLV